MWENPLSRGNRDQCTLAGDTVVYVNLEYPIVVLHLSADYVS